MNSNGRRLGLTKYLILPIAYYYLVKGYQKYWLQNDLRFLYREILKPSAKRIEDNQCIDYRDIKDELYANKVNEEKSMVSRLRNMIESKIEAGKSTPMKSDETDSENNSNLNMIKRF